jgi:hypothetical protein
VLFFERIRGFAKKTGGLGSTLSGFWPGGRQQRFLGCTECTPEVNAVAASAEAQQVSKCQSGPFLKPNIPM